MSTFELNLKDYIKKQTNNILFEYNNKLYFTSLLKSDSPNYIKFDELYKCYINFKKLGKNTYKCQDGIINKIEFDKDIILNWPLVNDREITSDSRTFITKFLNDKYNFNNEIMGLNDMNSSQIISFAQLIYLCSDAIKDYCTGDFSLEEIEAANKKFEKFIHIHNQTIKESFNEIDTLSIIPKIISEIELKYPYLSQIKEILEYNDKFYVIEPCIKYSNCLSIFFHFFKLEIVYYSFVREEDRKKPKLCSKCGKYSIGKCKCMTISPTYRRRQNRKCETLRKKLKDYLDKYKDVISEEYYRKTERMLEENHHWQDLNELSRLCDGIEEQLKETNKN